jgi:hypothetical protein
VLGTRYCTRAVSVDRFPPARSVDAAPCPRHRLPSKRVGPCRRQLAARLWATKARRAAYTTRGARPGRAGNAVLTEASEVLRRRPRPPPSQASRSPTRLPYFTATNYFSCTAVFHLCFQYLQARASALRLSHAHTRCPLSEFRLSYAP